MTRTMLADLDPALRPRERMLELGPDALSDVELVALLLGSGRRGTGVLDASRELLDGHGGLPGLARASVADLCRTPGIGPAKATRVAAALALARRFGTSTDRRATVRSGADVARLAAPVLAGQVDGALALLVCDRANRLQHAVVVPGVDAHTVVPPVRQVLAEALSRGGVALALAHRHPRARPAGATSRTGAPADGRGVGQSTGSSADGSSAPPPGGSAVVGSGAPMPCDPSATRAIRRAAADCGLRVLDHVVLLHDRWTSLLHDAGGGPG